METEEAEGVVDSNFVRKDFYLPPPPKDAPVELWTAWQEADKRMAAQAKRAFTLSLKHAEVPEFLQPKVLAKVGGVYRQSAMVGFVSDGVDASRIEAAVDANQGQRLVRAAMEAQRHTRGVESVARKSRNRRNNRAARFLRRVK